MPGAGTGGRVAPSPGMGSTRPSRHAQAFKSNRGFGSIGRSSRFLRTGSMIEPTPAQRRVGAILEHKAVSGLMTFVTIYALFGDDIRLAATPPSADDVFYGISTVALVLFAAEVVLNSYSRRDYMFGFYFWLDILATLSLIPDIGWIWALIVGEGDGGNSTGAIRAGRASRSATRAGRVVRIVRLVRLVRIVKLYKHLRRDKGNVEEDEDPINADQPSKVGKHLADLTTRRVILLVLTMLFGQPLFDPTTFSSNDSSVNEFQTDGLAAIHWLAFSNLPAENGGVIFRKNVGDYATNAGSLLYLDIHNTPRASVLSWLQQLRFSSDEVPPLSTNLEVNPANGWSYSHLRPSVAAIQEEFRDSAAPFVEITGCIDPATGATIAETTATSNCTSVAVFDQSDAVELEATLNLLKTLFVMFILGVGSFLFTKDAENLVIQPIERMVLMVKELAKNPLGAVVQKTKRKGGGYETQLLEATLAKIGKLLQIGFGEAGAEIIGQNMSSKGALDPLVKGRKMRGIFGFCDIRQFTDATECLQEEVMVFVNQIGDVVHRATHQYLGAANKNIGDAFLLVWRVDDDAHVTRPALLGSTPSLDTGEETKELAEEDVSLEQMCDNALFAFLKIMVDIELENRGGRLQVYQSHPKIKARWPEGYSVKMGFGLHLGWAIEGAIGSSFKIDASYLSPNVNMASRLEAATKQFRTPLLMSHWLYDLLSPAAKARCRVLDCVTVKGSAEPMKLYTFDVTSYPPEMGEEMWNPEDEGVSLADFERDDIIPKMQAELPAGFLAKFNKAVEAYLDGRWPEAIAELDAVLVMKPGDGPALALKDVLARFDNKKPEGWRGFRELTEK